MAQQRILEQIYEIILARKRDLPADSYTASLLRKGEDAVLKKIGEEACEVILASKTGSHEKIIDETADLIYHLMVLLGYHEVPLGSIYRELDRRLGVSGLRRDGREK